MTRGEGGLWGCDLCFFCKVYSAWVLLQVVLNLYFICKLLSWHLKEFLGFEKNAGKIGLGCQG